MASNYYLIERKIGGEPKIHGPWDDEDRRDDAAKEIVKSFHYDGLDPNRVITRVLSGKIGYSLFWLSIDDTGELLVGTYLDSEVLEWLGVEANKKEL
jgi:hypothetical protein